MTLLSLPIVLDAVAKASVLLALTALGAAALGRASASARHFVWTLGLLSALAVPALSLALPRWELPIVRIAAPVASPAAGLPLSGGSEPALSPASSAVAPPRHLRRVTARGWPAPPRGQAGWGAAGQRPAAGRVPRGLPGGWSAHSEPRVPDASTRSSQASGTRGTDYADQL